MKRSGWRVLTWGALLALISVDAVVASPIGLTQLYFIPLGIAALTLRAGDAYALAALAAVARILFGPVGDPLDLRAHALVLSVEVQTATNAALSLVAYLGVAALLRRIVAQRRELHVMRRASETDALTGLANRRALARFLDENAGAPATVLMIDLDHFKRVNDTHGHAAGDAVLQDLGRRLHAVVRAGDLVARAGGEEFIVVLRGAPRTVAERVGLHACAVVRDVPFPIPGGTLAVTTSIGAAIGVLDDALIDRADRALYRAKETGRDRLVIDEEERGALTSS